MLVLIIIFYLIGIFFMYQGISLNVISAPQQTVQYIMYLISFICFSTGSIIIGIKKICSLLENKTYNSTSTIASTSTTSNIQASSSTVSSRYKICKKCGTKNSINSTTCKDCGEYL